MENLWIYLCILASLLAGFAWGLNGIFKVNGIRVSFWRSLIAVLITSPSIFFIDINQGTFFYGMFLLMGLLGIAADTLYFNVAKDYGGAGPTRLMNLRVPLALIIGWFLFPASWDLIIDKGLLYQVGVVISFILICSGLFYMKSNPVASKVLYLMMMPVVIYISIDIMTKYAFIDSNEQTLNLVFYAVFILSSSMLLGSYIISLIFKTKLIAKDENTIKYSFYICLSWLALILCKNYSLMIMPNPGYYSLFAGASCLWIMLYHKLKGEKDESSPVAGLILALGALILTFIIS